MGIATGSAIERQLSWSVQQIGITKKDGKKIAPASKDSLTL
jgi:hypothetical protein